MILDILLFVVGFILLIKSADVFIDSSSDIAACLKIPKIVVGLTIVAIGTSLPELAVSIQSLLNGSADLLLGNVLGSNITNILLIVGVCSLITPVKVKDNTVKKEIPICLLLTFLVVILFSDQLIDSSVVNVISRSDGLVLVLFFAIFIYYLFGLIKNKEESRQEAKYPIYKSIIFIALSIIIIIFSSDLIVTSSINIANILGVSERIISLTIISLGTSLPELVTAVTAARKKELDILVGNIIGSNVINICIVLGLPVAIIGALEVSTFVLMDFVVVLLAPLLLFIFSRNKYVINKYEGMIMLAVYVFYYIFLFI